MPSMVRRMPSDKLYHPTPTSIIRFAILQSSGNSVRCHPIILFRVLLRHNFAVLLQSK